MRAIALPPSSMWLSERSREARARFSRSARANAPGVGFRVQGAGCRVQGGTEDGREASEVVVRELEVLEQREVGHLGGHVHEPVVRLSQTALPPCPHAPLPLKARGRTSGSSRTANLQRQQRGSQATAAHPPTVRGALRP